jgi:predicted dienelactone hydrolase
VSRDFVDSARQERFAENADGPRRIVATVYYPAEPAADAEPAPYTDGAMAERLAARVHLPAATAKLIHSHAYAEAPIVAARFPVVLFAPGIGTQPLEYTSNVEDLASHGYVVAVLYPTYSVPVTVFSDGSVVEMTPAGIRSEDEPPGTSEEQTDRDRDAIGAVWTADVRFALDSLSELNRRDPLLEDHLELDRVGVYGHSFGGATAAEVLRTDARFKAAINMDGKVFGMTDPHQIQGPLMWMASDYSAVSDAQLAQIKMSRAEFDEKIRKHLEHRNEFLSGLEQGYELILKGSTHSTYITDEAFLGSLIPGMKDSLATVDGALATRTINAYVVAFWDRYLKEQEASWFDGSVHPEVELNRVRRPKHDN